MNPKVLIVDDEESILTILKIMMEREGYNVFAVSSAEKAFAVLEKENALNNGNGFDLIITDVVMPKMNGYELAKQILDHVPDQPILFISGFNSSRELVKLIDTHPNLEYQSKPFGFDDIKQKISLILQLN